ncbi:MAG: GNAT family acetyltransferase [Burkholderiales bacterium]|nr:GNAT family acetyltransferase [Burkholderiales bacterium]
MRIRTFRPEDQDRVIALWQACDLTRPWNDPVKDIARKQTEQPELFFVGELGGRIVASAMAGYDGHRGWVNYLSVEPALQGRGLGTVLMRHIEARLTERGCPKLNLQVRQGNDAVLGFYARLGYGNDQTIGLGKRLIHDTPPGTA